MAYFENVKAQRRKNEHAEALESRVEQSIRLEIGTGEI